MHRKKENLYEQAEQFPQMALRDIRRTVPASGSSAEGEGEDVVKAEKETFFHDQAPPFAIFKSCLSLIRLPLCIMRVLYTLDANAARNTNTPP